MGYVVLVVNVNIVVSISYFFMGELNETFPSPFKKNVPTTGNVLMGLVARIIPVDEMDIAVSRTLSCIKHYF